MCQAACLAHPPSPLPAAAATAPNAHTWLLPPLSSPARAPARPPVPQVVIANGLAGCDGNASLQRNVCALEILAQFLRLLYYFMADATLGAFFR